ncbi:tetratricopeptide repeat protein [Pasteurella sp. PK-2025]|uniref:tetratricopeptide repeat protein n=1 Tax=unclassified Pasteurella TaxID=2621516 RepID=UPI003C7221F9
MQTGFKRLLSMTLLVSAMNVFAQLEADPVFEQGAEAYKRGDHTTAFKLWLSRAEQGDMSAQFNVGRMYDEGDGVEQNKQLALKWYQKSAEQHHPDAQYHLALMYSEGDGVAQDFKQAYKWYSQSALQGDARAVYNLGTLYANGEGVERNWERAKMYFKQACNAGLKEGCDWE